jgi:hypothetical protein
LKPSQLASFTFVVAQLNPDEHVMVLETGVKTRPQASVAVQVSVTVPAHPGIVEKVESADVPALAQAPVNPFVKGILVAAGNAPQIPVIFAGAIIVANGSVTVIVLETEKVLPHAVAVQVSIAVSPATPLPQTVVREKVEGAELPVIAQVPVKPFVKLNVVGASIVPQLTVIFAGAVIVGTAAALTVILLLTTIFAPPQGFAILQVSVITPPSQAVEVPEKIESGDVPAIAQAPFNPLE